jgi:hypothetical protein
MSPPENPEKLIDTMMVTGMVQGAETEALLELCQVLARRVGVHEIDGLALIDWFQREKVARMERMLIDLEDKNPAIAAQFQSIIDDCKRRLGEKSSGG